MSHDAIYQRHPHSAGRVIDGLAFIVTPDSSRMHTLNAAATLLWQLASPGFTAEQGAAEMTEHFEVDAGQALTDLKECVDAMVARHILVAH